MWNVSRSFRLELKVCHFFFPLLPQMITGQMCALHKTRLAAQDFLTALFIRLCICMLNRKPSCSTRNYTQILSQPVHINKHSYSRSSNTQLKCHAPFGIWRAARSEHWQILKVFIFLHRWTGRNPPNIFSRVMDLLSLNLHDNTLPFSAHGRQLQLRYHLYYYWAVICRYTEEGNWASEARSGGRHSAYGDGSLSVISLYYDWPRSIF